MQFKVAIAAVNSQPNSQSIRSLRSMGKIFSALGRRYYRYVPVELRYSLFEEHEIAAGQAVTVSIVAGHSLFSATRRASL